MKEKRYLGAVAWLKSQRLNRSECENAEIDQNEIERRKRVTLTYLQLIARREKRVYIPLNLNKCGGDYNFIIHFHIVLKRYHNIYIKKYSSILFICCFN